MQIQGTNMNKFQECLEGNEGLGLEALVGKYMYIYIYIYLYIYHIYHVCKCRYIHTDYFRYPFLPLVH